VAKEYIRMHCLFCRDRERIDDLYPQTFAPEDCTPAVFSARRSTEHFHYAIVRCRNCGLVFSRDVLPEETLTDLYSRSTVTFADYTDIIRHDYWRCIEPHMPSIGGRGAALEIGCSSGFFMEELLDRGFREVYGCEPSIEAKSRARPEVREHITTGFFTGDRYAPETFDLVCSFQTLDHLSDPLDVLRSIYRIVKPGGLVYFVTHDVEALQAKLLGGASPIIDIEHMYLFNKSTLRRLVETAGFEVPDVSGIQNSYPLDYWVKMLPLPERVRRVARKVLDLSGLGPLRLPLQAGNIFLVGRKRP
jgi:SAM-dependent methyltransferase